MAYPPLAALGGFVFSPSEGAYEMIEFRWSQPRVALPVIGGPPVKQFMGPGERSVSITGSIWPEIQRPGLTKIDDLSTLARIGIPLALVLAVGGYKGMWSLDEGARTDRELALWGFPGEIGFELSMTSA